MLDPNKNSLLGQRFRSVGRPDEHGRERFARIASSAEVPVPTLVGLESTIITQRTFPLHKWYYANPIWYYHAHATEHRLRADARFYDLVDPALRELCNLLLAAGLRTTPSCQGHFYLRARFKRVWDELRREALLIHGDGLVVRDSETARTYWFQDSDYKLAWTCFDDFCEQASLHQSHGYVGIVVPIDRLRLAQRLESDAYRSATARIERDYMLSRLLGETIFSIFVDPPSPEARDAEWQSITTYFRKVLRAGAAETLQPI